MVIASSVRGPKRSEDTSAGLDEKEADSAVERLRSRLP